MFCILHISRSYPLDCYDYWSTSGANKQPRYILRQKKKPLRRRKRGRRKRNKIFLNEFDAKRSSLISVSALKKTAAQHRKNFQKLGCSPKSMESLPLVPWGFKEMLIKSFFPPIFLTKKLKIQVHHTSFPLLVAGTISTLMLKRFQSCLVKSPVRHCLAAYSTNSALNFRWPTDLSWDAFSRSSSNTWSNKWTMLEKSSKNCKDLVKRAGECCEIL